MPEHPRDLQWRLDDAQAAQAEWRAVVDILLRQGDAVFTSRRWRWGSRLLRPIEALLRWSGRDVSPAQSIAHWRDIVAAHEAAIARRHAVLEQRLITRERDLADALDALPRE